MDKFGMRQFIDPNYLGTKINYDSSAFADKINEYYESGDYPLVEGYAPFCKHLFVPNFVGPTKCDYVIIADDNKHHIETDYIARTPIELPVLSRWIDKSKVEAPDATFLDIILYSREQIILENLAQNETPPDSDAPWGIICVKGQTCDYELPMQPITALRNALGAEEGGSGVPLDKEKYRQSVEFWKKHCSIK
jgi:hypothetical protein